MKQEQFHSCLDQVRAVASVLDFHICVRESHWRRFVRNKNQNNLMAYDDDGSVLPVVVVVEYR